MEPRQHEYLIDVFADPDHVKEVVKGTFPAYTTPIYIYTSTL